MKSDLKILSRFKIGKLIDVRLDYSHLRKNQLKLFNHGGFWYWNLFFGKFLLSFHKKPF